MEAGTQMEGIMVLLGCSAMFPSDLWLAVHQRVWSAVGIRVSNVKVPHGVALPVFLRQNHASSCSSGFLAHNCLVIRSGTVGRWDEGTVAMGGDIVRPGDIASDRGVGGHGRGLQVVLGVG